MYACMYVCRYACIRIHTMHASMHTMFLHGPLEKHRYMKATGTIAIVYQTLIPLIYVHTILPLMVTFLAIPFYYLIWTLCVSFWAARFRRAVAGISVLLVGSGFVLRPLHSGWGTWDVDSCLQSSRGQGYWNTTVPLRYCMSTARSDVNSLISDVMSNNVVIRAYRDQDPPDASIALSDYKYSITEVLVFVG